MSRIIRPTTEGETDLKVSSTFIKTSNEKAPESEGGRSVSSLDHGINTHSREWRRECSGCVSGPLVNTPLAYFESGISTVNPGLVVHGAGKIGVPLSTRDADAIIDMCQKHPHNFIEVEDSGDNLGWEVPRDAWELPPEEFSIQNPDWVGVVSLAAGKMKKGLGIPTTDVKIELRKLLFFEPGQGFTSASSPAVSLGLLGRLAIYLPSEHQGGEVISTCGKLKTELDTEECSDYESSMLAWLGDASTEILEITTGYQCLLLYDVIPLDREE